MSAPPSYKSSSAYNYNLDESDQPYMSPPISPKSATPTTESPLCYSPPRYSDRLHHLNEKRIEPLHLSLDKPMVQKPAAQPIIIQMPFFVEDKAEEEMLIGKPQEDCKPEVWSIDLMSTTKLEEGSEFYDYSDLEKTPFFSGGHRRHRGHSRQKSALARWRKFSYDEREFGWMTFIGIAVLIFLLMTAGGVLVAWTAGGSILANVNSAAVNASGMHKTYFQTRSTTANVRGRVKMSRARY